MAELPLPVGPIIGWWAGPPWPPVPRPGATSWDWSWAGATSWAWSWSWALGGDRGRAA